MANGSVTNLPNLAATSSSSKFTYRGILAYQVDSDATLYVSRSRGFKSGGYNLYAPTGTPVAPEVLDATEGGAKTEWFGRRRSEEHTSELQSLMRTSYAVFCLTK